MKHHSRYFVLMLGLMLLVCPSTFAEEDVNDRLNRFQQAYSRNRVEALNILNPVNHPRIVDTIATVYGDENTQQRMTYEATYMKADEILKTATGDEVFERMHYYMQKKHAQRVRQHFVRVLGQLADERTFPELVKLVYRENEPDIQFEMARAIANYNTDDAFIAMYKLAKDALNVNISLIAFRGLQRTNNEKTSELLRKLYDSRKAPGQVRGEALSTLYKRNDDFALNKAKEALDDEATAVRVAAIQIAVENDRSDLKDKFIMMLAAPEWEVRSAAVRACGELKITEAVGPMIELWKNEGGRIGEDIHKALLKITGKSFGPRVEYWEHWFNNLEEPVKEGEKEGDYISYHGLETKSKNIAFVIDHSGSMSEKVKAKHGGYVGEGAVVKGDTKMAFVKAELIRVIKSLPKDTRFNIVAFEAKVTVWEKAQTDATKRNKSSAIKWVESLRPSGQTNVYDAIVEAFGRMNPGGKVNTRYKGGPDTIFVLSDGLPNAGTIPNAPEILEAVKEMNKIRQVTIHTIGVGKMTKMFLEPLAKQNNGTFKLVAE